jgi:tetratricopeptide (TPR) repeat protein
MNRPSVRILIVICFIIPFTALPSQDITKREFIRSVQAADLFFYYDKDYEKAASLYEPMVKAHPDNENLAAKLGICYLNIDGKKKDALRLLEFAASNVVTQDKEYVEFGDKAPLDTYIYLAAAYHVNDNLEKAVSLYNEAKERLSETDIFREDYMDLQIRDCRYAMEMKKKPLTILYQLFAPWLSEYKTRLCICFYAEYRG